MALAQHNDYSVSAPLTGDGVINKIELAGWSSTLAAKTTQGRVFWTLASGVFTIYTDAAKTASIVTSTTACTSGTDKALVADNTSGITGTVNITFGQNSTGEIIISYANESDLEQELSNSTSFLASSNWPTASGSNRFEAAFRPAKRMLDTWLESTAARGGGPTFTRGRPDLTTLSEPRQLADVHAMLTAAVIVRRGTSINLDAGQIELANDYERRARKRFSELTIRWDTSRDGLVDSDTMQFGSCELFRG